MSEIPSELMQLLVEEGLDYIAAKIGETAKEKSIIYQAVHFLITKGVEFVLPTVIAAGFGDPTAFALGLIKRDIRKIQKDLDAFKEIPFHTIRDLIQDAKDEVEDEVNHRDAYDKFKKLESKAIKAINSSKIIENKVQAAEIAILAKAYIKRFDFESQTFLELHQVDSARKASLARQIQRILTQFISMPEYMKAREKAMGAWYRRDTITLENHDLVDMVDALKVMVYANSVLCLNTVREAKVKKVEDSAVLSKSWYLKYDWVPEGERFALEICITENEIGELRQYFDENQDDSELEGGSEDTEEDEEGATEGNEEADEDSTDNEEEENEEIDLIEDMQKEDEHESEDEQLSEDEDTLYDEGGDNNGDDETLDEEDEEKPEASSIQIFSVMDAPFAIYTDLAGTVFIKSQLSASLLLNDDLQEDTKHERVLNCWKLSDPPETLHLKFQVSLEALEYRSQLTTKRLLLDEEVADALIDFLSKSDNSKSAERARRLARFGTVSNISWKIHWTQLQQSIGTEKDLQSPLFTALPLADNQPHLRAIVCGAQNKVGVKMTTWVKKKPDVVVGVIMWNEDDPDKMVKGSLRRLKGNVKDIQVKNIDWDEFVDDEFNGFIRFDVILFSPLFC